MSVLAAVTSAESYEKKMDSLGAIMGEIFDFKTANLDPVIASQSGYQVSDTKSVEEQKADPEFDRDKFNSLRAKFASGQ